MNNWLCILFGHRTHRIVGTLVIVCVRKGCTAYVKWID